MTTEPLDSLHASLVRRLRPEDVARQGLDLLGDSVSPALRSALRSAAGDRDFSFSSMSEDFDPVVGCDRQVVTLSVMARDFGLDVPDCDPSDPVSVRSFLTALGNQVGWVPGADVRERYTRSSRLSHNRLTKLWRALTNLDGKLAVFERSLRVHRALLVGRSALALEVPRDDFVADPLTAVTVAYLVARRNLRREFTLSGKHGTTDEVLDALLEGCEASDSTRWDVVALVRPTPRVLSRLDDRARGELLGRWSSELRSAAELLRDAASRSNLDRTWMVVSRGDDSSTWNAAARWYNTSRDNLFACLQASGMSSVLESFCPPKAVRLMAADLVRYHQYSGGEPHPDTRVAAALPWPWEVVSGEVVLSAETVAAVCTEQGVDPVTSGWAALRAPREVEAFVPTRELVHGIAVADPLLAGLLRRAGAWSGASRGGLRPEYQRDLLALAGFLETSSDPS